MLLAARRVMLGAGLVLRRAQVPRVARSGPRPRVVQFAYARVPPTYMELAHHVVLASQPGVMTPRADSFVTAALALRGGELHWLGEPRVCVAVAAIQSAFEVLIDAVAP